MNYTKGKWEPIFNTYPEDPKTICIGVGINTTMDEGIYTEFICNSILPDNDYDYINQREVIEANMKLIAAAPELLEALISLKKWAGSVDDWRGPDPDIELVNNAIRKASR